MPASGGPRPARCRAGGSAASTPRPTAPAPRPARVAAPPRPRPRWASTAYQRCSGSHTTRDPSTASAVTSLRNMASGLATPWRRFFTTTWARWSLVRPGAGEQALGPQGEVGRRGGQAGLLLPRLEERGADDALGHLLECRTPAPCRTGPSRMAAARQLQRGAPRGAAGLHVDDGDAGHGQRGQHPVARRPRRRRRCRRRRRLHVRPGPTPASASAARDGHDPHVGGGRVAEAAEGVEARPRRSRTLAHRWNTQVTEGSPSGPGTSSPSSRTAVPGDRSSPCSRVTTRSRGSPSSSTIPRP